MAPTCRKQTLLPFRTSIVLVVLCFEVVWGRLHERHLENECPVGTLSTFLVDEPYKKLRCFAAGGKYCTATMTGSFDATADSFVYAGTGCIDMNNLVYDNVYFDNLTLEECENKCMIVMSSLGSTLRGIWRDNRNEITGCWCIFDDGVLSAIPDGADAISLEATGMGEIQNISHSDSQCFKLDNDSFAYVGTDCVDMNDNFYDSVYFKSFTVEECGNKCITVTETLNSTLRGIWRDTSLEETGCWCIFDDEVISMIPVGAAGLGLQASGKGEIKNISLSDGQCFKFISSIDGQTFSVGKGTCKNWDRNDYDYVYFVAPTILEQYKGNCSSVIRDNRKHDKVRFSPPGNGDETSDCHCIFNETFKVSSVGVGSPRPNIKNNSTNYTRDLTESDCSIPFGQCYAYKTSRQADAVKDSTTIPVEVCMLPDCETPNLNFEDLYCAVSSCTSFEIGVDRPFNDIAIVAATDPSDCCDACKREDGCKLFSWRSDDGYCYLKSEQGVATWYDSNVDIVTGYI